MCHPSPYDLVVGGTLNLHTVNKDFLLVLSYHIYSVITGLQIRGGIEDNLKVIFLFSQ